MRNSERKLNQNVIQLLQRQHKEPSRLQFPPHSFQKFFKKLPTHSTPLCKLPTVSENRIYRKFQVMDWNDIWHVFFRVC